LDGGGSVKEKHEKGEKGSVEKESRGEGSRSGCGGRFRAEKSFAMKLVKEGEKAARGKESNFRA